MLNNELFSAGCGSIGHVFLYWTHLLGNGCISILKVGNRVGNGQEE